LWHQEGYQLPGVMKESLNRSWICLFEVSLLLTPARYLLPVYVLI
jgi:hypothetical protein